MWPPGRDNGQAYAQDRSSRPPRRQFPQPVVQGGFLAWEETALARQANPSLNLTGARQGLDHAQLMGLLAFCHPLTPAGRGTPPHPVGRSLPRRQFLSQRGGMALRARGRGGARWPRRPPPLMLRPARRDQHRGPGHRRRRWRRGRCRRLPDTTTARAIVLANQQLAWSVPT